MQVFAEAALFHFLFEGLVGGGQDAHPRLNRFDAAEPLETLVLQTRSIFACKAGAMSPISSRNSVPPSACSNLPMRCRTAPV